jgi:hypothetical protein
MAATGTAVAAVRPALRDIAVIVLPRGIGRSGVPAAPDDIVEI